MARNGGCAHPRRVTPSLSATRTLSLTLTAELDAPYTARALLAAVLPHWRVGTELCERTLLIASELVANVVVHGSPEEPVLLDVALHEDRLELQVADRDPCLPQQRSGDDPLAESGRGLQLVARLARRWGVEPCDQGKRVFAVLDREPLPV